ncbi:hypothetical protein DFQ27_007345 [Actinomortierella ambigua]|uniref:Uncharacterized protein n=1 Tax=Actinomortierella ambigua TaxID=1343610 RepID=A0A9P6PTY3_9FUNG|nr:hypothetical protein DFQ27_007345 [Actinomortierella ambigua]
MKKELLAFGLSLLVIVFAFTTLWHFEFQFAQTGSETQRPRQVQPGGLSTLPNTKVGQFWTQQTASGTKYVGFVHKSCAETMSFGYTWFSTIYNIACDKNDPSPLCTVWLENSNGYVSLGEKSLALWKMVHQAEDIPDIVVKLDDDTIIQKHVLDEFIDNFAKQPCVIGGTMVKWAKDEYDFWWPLGRLYMFKRSAMPPSSSHIWTSASDFNKYEDGQIGYIMGVPTNDTEHICWLDGEKYAHSQYKEGDPNWDGRVEIKFRYLSAGCTPPK